MIYQKIIRLSNKLVPVVLILGLSLDIELTCMAFNIIYTHSKIGLESIIYDYIHSDLVNKIYLAILRVFYLNLVLYTIEFLL